MLSLIASDGLEYADILQRVAGNPLKNTRNRNIRYYQQTTSDGENFARCYAQGFDSVCPEGDPGPSPKFLEAHRAGLSAAYQRHRATPII